MHDQEVALGSEIHGERIRASTRVFSLASDT
jgi:hypothetical protein